MGGMDFEKMMAQMKAGGGMPGMGGMGGMDDDDEGVEVSELELYRCTIACKGSGSVSCVYVYVFIS